MFLSGVLASNAGLEKIIMRLNEDYLELVVSRNPDTV